MDDSSDVPSGRARHASPDVVTLEGPLWRRFAGDGRPDIAGTLWRAPSGLGCPFCPGSPPLSYQRGGVWCPRCDHVLNLIDIAEPVSGGPCADCGEPRDIAGTGTLCRRCVLTSYLQLRVGERLSRSLPNAPDSRWVEAVGFPREADIRGTSAPLSDSLTSVETPFSNSGGSRWEHYAVASDGTYGGGELANGRDRQTLSVRALTAGGRDKWDDDARSGQMLTAGVRGNPHAGHVLLYRLTDAGGLVYEAALPVGDIDEPESAPHTTERGRNVRDRPYSDRVIVGHGVDSRREPAFRRAARRWLRNELPRTGRPPGSTDWTPEYWHSELDRARAVLRRDNIEYSESRLRERMRHLGDETNEVSRSTFTRYKERWGLLPPVA